jgi:flagellar hook assembly protein FlgD
LPVEGNVSIDIYNLTGSRVAHIEKGVQTEGEYTIQWDARNNPNGMYVAMITVKTSDDILRQQVKMIITK